jgi:hypothetical protein
MEGVFESWIGQPVVIQVALGRFKLSLRGKVLKDHGETLLMRPQCGPDLEIFKTKVLAIEQMGVPFADGHAWHFRRGSV